MDEIVARSLAKWPNVPAVYGWLSLDRRGNWLIRSTRATDRFERIGNAALREFIGRNYQADEKGRWYFQNGPQRVYVELEVAPWVWRLGPGHSVTAHSGQPARPGRCLMDEQGRLYLETDMGFGLVHTLDVEQAADAVEQGVWILEEVAAADLPGRFGYVCSPAALRQAMPDAAKK